MSDIRETMVDTSFVEEFATYLKDQHGIDAWVVNGDDAPVPLGKTAVADYPHVRFYPFGDNGFGGIKCAAASPDALERAESHIALGVKGIRQMLLRDMELLQTSDEMLQLSGQMSFLFKLARKTIGVNEIDEFLRIVLEEVSPSIHADFGIVRAKGRENRETEILFDIGEIEYAALLRQNGLERIPEKDSTVIYSLPDGTSVLYCPIKEKEGPIGHIAFFKKADKRFFTSYEKKFVSIIEHTISPTVETIRLYGSLQDLYVNTVKSLAAAIDAKDQYTHGHSYRVARVSNAIGRQLGMSEKQLHDLQVAAYMHDLGKIGIPESILGKPGKLTDEEFREIKRHPLLTNKILEPIHLPPVIVDAAVQHHERIDGKGYPFGLKGESISFLARIITVADVFDALTSKRPYRDAMTVEKALGLLCEGIGTEFDPRMVQAVVRALQLEELETEWLPAMPELRFADIHNMERFLADLSAIIHRKTPSGPPAADAGQETLPA